MSKRIVLLLDGTSNEIEEDRTNIVRLYGCLQRNDKQVVYYNPGVGTLGIGKAWTRFGVRLYEVLGLAFGVGLDDNVKDAYRFLVNTWEEGDEVYLFGFSRGAYSARVLAGFMRAVGLVQPEQENLTNYVYRAYKRVAETGDFEKEVRIYEKMLKPRRVPIRFLGLFDTVSSVITFRNFVPSLEYLPFTRNNHMVESVRHAVAIHERRTMFQATLWPGGQIYWPNPFPPKEGSKSKGKVKVKDQDLKELWFTGCHTDVGGGNSEEKSGLAKIAANWMIDEAKTCGLTFSTPSVNIVVKAENSAGPVAGKTPPDPLAPINESLRWWWWIVELVPRRKNERSTRNWSVFGWYIPLGEHRRIPEGARIHNSVKTRMEKTGEKPPNLPKLYSWD